MFPRPRLALLLAPLLLLLSTACSSGDKSDTVTLQLDWTPNTNHIGVYVAQSQGWYKDAGIKLKILPYTDVNPDTIVANRKADFGISFPANVIFSRAAGLTDVVSVAGVLQKNVTELAVLDSSSIQRPRDFDGKTYAGFGLPYEAPQIATVIKADGGKGEFQTATLSTAAYEALYNKRADFTEIFTAWEGIEAGLRGIKLRTFRYDNFGVPDFPGVIMIANQLAIAERADLYTRFLDATRRGYEYAAQHPAEAAAIFEKAVPKGTFPDTELVDRSTAMLAPAFVDSRGRWGTQDASKWQAYSSWMLGQGIVKDANDKVLTGSVPGGPLFVNNLVEPSSARAP